MSCGSSKPVNTNQTKHSAVSFTSDKSHSIYYGFIEHGSSGKSVIIDDLFIASARKLVYRDYSMIKQANSESGLIAIKIFINPQGDVTYAEILKSETTNDDKSIKTKTLESIIKYEAVQMHLQNNVAATT